MQLIHPVVVRQHEQIASLVSIGELLTVERLTVQWLVDVAHVMNQESQSVRLRQVGLPWVEPVLDVVVDVATLVFESIVLKRQPLN